jgi:hypothetical protein
MLSYARWMDYISARLNKQLQVQQPVFEVCIHYNATERQVLSGARRIWAHIGRGRFRVP